MKRRVFIGFKVSPKVKKDALEWMKGYKEMKVRWVLPENLHITLVPPWYEEETGSLNISLRRIIEPLGIESFNIQFDIVSFGPNPKRPRLMWAEGKAPQEMIKLKKALEKNLGKVPEEREFKLHLTLARFHPKDFRYFTVRYIGDKIDWSQRVNSITLFESKLRHSGVEYKIIDDFIF